MATFRLQAAPYESLAANRRRHRPRPQCRRTPGRALLLGRRWYSLPRASKCDGREWLVPVSLKMMDEASVGAGSKRRRYTGNAVAYRNLTIP
jgi:hypothetical protein